MDLIDATDPAKIDASWNGLPAIRISVYANIAGQAFDLEAGNAGADNVATAVEARWQSRRWSWCYVNQSTEGPMADALERVGLAFTPADDFPALGVYEWCADPDDNIARGLWRPAARPIAIQRQYLAGYDVSATAATCPVRVAGYLDGATSAWPPDAWSRFALVNDLASVLPPAPPTPGVDDVSNLIMVETSAPGSTLPHANEVWLINTDQAWAVQILQPSTVNAYAKAGVPWVNVAGDASHLANLLAAVRP